MSVYDFMKRLIDIVGGISLLIVLSPCMIVASLLILIDGTGGGIFADAPDRVGLDGKLFRMYKFRTMIPESGKTISDEYLKKGKIRTDEDTRVTIIGKILRKTDFDETPQLLNVIIGNMSLVGPRPYFEVEIEKGRKECPDGDEKFEKILSVRSGMTGLWQVSGRNDIDLQGRVMCDSQYVNEKSLLGDMKILLKTPGAVISRKGAW